MILSLVGLAILFLICFLGVPLGYGMLIIGTVGFAYLRGPVPAMEMAGQQIVDLSMNYNFSTLPLFILMGAFVHRAKLSDDLYEAANAWLSHWRGGLAMTTIAACAGFSAVSGSSLATAATMSKVAMPPMRKYKYHDSLATGSIAAGGTLGILIPPSVPMVIYGILTNSDIGKLFMAGILPGLLLVVLFIGSIAVLTALRPNVGPRGPRSDWRARLIALGRVRGILVLFTIVLGGIYFGIFTPTEAAGIVIELGLITPPIGMNVFVVKSVVKDVELWTIFAGVWPFVAAGLVALGLVIAFPEIALWLPSKM